MQAILKRILERSAERRSDWTPSVSVLAAAWPGLVGEQLADVTRPIEVDWEAEELTVETVSRTWRRELARREGELLERIDEVLPWRLERLQFRANLGADAFDDSAEELSDDPLAAAPDEPIASPDRAGDPEPVEKPRELEDSLESLPDGTAASARRILAHLRDED